MQDFIERLAEHAGIDQDSAESVVDFLKTHAAELPGLLGSSVFGGKAAGLAGAVTGFLGGHNAEASTKSDDEDGDDSTDDSDDESDDDDESK